MVRTRGSDKSGLNKGTWTSEEDRKLIAYVTRYGCWNWRQLPKYAGLSRCGKSCRLRWMNYLRPNIKRGNYSKQEEQTIIRLQNSLGNKWSAIAAQLPGRTDNEIKNYWHTNLKKQAMNECKPIQERILEAENVSPCIIESLMLSPKTSSSDFSSNEKDVNVVADSWEGCGEDGYSFWTQPFWTDNTVNDKEFQAPIMDHGFVSSYSSAFDEEFLSPSLIWEFEYFKQKLME